MHSEDSKVGGVGRLAAGTPPVAGLEAGVGVGPEGTGNLESEFEFVFTREEGFPAGSSNLSNAAGFEARMRSL